MSENKLECVCEGNWRLIVNDHQYEIGGRYVDTLTKKEYHFFGIVWGDDDFYYGMSSKEGVMLLSCVGNIEGHGYELIEEPNQFRGMLTP